MDKLKFVGLAIGAALLLGGCAASELDKFASNSVDLAKQQTGILLADNEKQTETIVEAVIAANPEAEEAIRNLHSFYQSENAKLKDELAAQHHELNKLTESLDSLMNGALGFLGLGGAGLGGLALGKRGKKNSSTTS